MAHNPVSVMGIHDCVHVIIHNRKLPKEARKARDDHHQRQYRLHDSLAHVLFLLFRQKRRLLMRLRIMFRDGNRPFPLQRWEHKQNNSRHRRGKPNTSQYIDQYQ